MDFAASRRILVNLATMKPALKWLVISCAWLAACGDSENGAAPPSPIDLRVELLRGANVSIDTQTPHFSWRQEPTESGGRQVAYRIVVDTANTAAHIFWDSGVVTSIPSQGIAYAGRSLLPRRQYRWRVQVWNQEGGPSPLSEPQVFSVGAFDSAMPPRLPLTTETIEAGNVREIAPGHLFIAFPAVAFGTLSLQFPRVHATGSIDVILGEHAVGDRVWRSAADGFTPEIDLVTHAATLWTSGEAGELRLELPARASPGAADLPTGITGILPFRYVEVIGDPASVTDVRVRQLAVTYPFDDSASEFKSSDAVLNDVWKLSKYTMKATSAFGLYVDGNRERLPYEADAYINQLGHYNVDAEYSLARYTIAHLLRHPTWPTEWILHDVFLAWADFQYTGDDSFLRENFSQLTRFTLLPLARADGLISTRGGRVSPEYRASLGMATGPNDIVDWPEVERDGYEMMDYNTVVNLFHFRALEILTSIAEVVDRPADATMFRARSELVRGAILAKLFDRQRGVFVDGEGSTHASLHANMFALAFDIVPERDRSAVMTYVKSRGMAVSVYGAQYLLEGLYLHGEGDYALSLLTSRGQRSWAHMIYDLGATVAHEAWDPVFKPNEDWNHAWGAAPANIIPRWLMGIRPLSPGFERFIVAPQIGSLQWATMRLPTIRGTVVVNAKVEPDGTRDIDLVVPPNSQAIVVPLCRSPLAEVWVDGARVEVMRTASPPRVGPLGPGRHDIDCRAG
jgi:alpha-L-rhamnosidase